jgi:multidrug efflux pump subunit AcrB
MLNLASKAKPYLGAVVLTALLLTAGGIYSATRMASGVYPEVTFPRIAVVARVPDWDVTRMDAKVTRPLEEAVTGVLGVANVRSKTIRGGSELSIDFNPGTDMKRAETLTWNRIGAKRSELPPNMELTVEQMTPSVFPILSLVLTGGDNASQLRDYAFYQLAPLIKTVPDVLYANVAGGDVREIEVIARPDDLLAHGMSAADLADQIAQTSQLLPVGRIEGQPFAYQIIVNNQAETSKQVGDLVISTKNGQPLRVRDVADVKVERQDRALSIGYDQKDAVVITVFRRLGGNTVNVSQGVRELLKKNGLTRPTGDPDKKTPRNIAARVVYDQATFVNTAVVNVRDAILVGGLFSILILLAFLRSWRATLISALAIPTTLAITFLFLHWSGETLNLMSLGGLAVAIGLIIDDTVVVVENIARHLAPSDPAHRPVPDPDPVPDGTTNHPGRPSPSPGSNGIPGTGTGSGKTTDPVDAASSEITGAVVGSTLTTVLVFVPLAFIVGVYGQFFASLSWSLSIAVLVSMVISLTLVPVFAARFLAGRPMPGPGPIYRFVAHVYEVVLGVALRFPWVTLTLSVAAVGIGVVLFMGIPGVIRPLETGLMPAMDEGAFVFDYWAPSGTPLAETERMAKEVEKILAKNPDVDTYVRRTGAELGLFATQTSRGDIQVVLRPAEENPFVLLTKPERPKLEELEKELKAQGRTLEQAREEIRKKYRRRPLKDVMSEIDDEVKDNFAEHQLKTELVQIMQDELNDLSGANKPIEVKIFGPDQAVLRDLASKAGEMLEKKGKPVGVKEVNSNVREGNPDLMVEIDGARADRLGLKPDAVARQLRAMFLGIVAAQVPESSTRLTDIRVRYPDDIRFGPKAANNNERRFDTDRVLRQWVLLPPGSAPPSGTAAVGPPNLSGPARAVPLSAFAKLKPIRTPEEQYRENQLPVGIITAEIDESKAGLGTVAAEVRRLMADFPLPAGYRWEMGGHYVRQREAFFSFWAVLVVAVVLVGIMLAFQFRSVVLPLLIFLTQPLSLVSGLFALWLADVPLNVSSGMGLILLIGLDMKNGIILVEYIQQLRKEGMELRPALLLAGRTRFRPILMTSLAAILGLFPLALGIGPGAQMQQPLAIVVIGGLTANMLFTRMIIPVGYLVLERRKAQAKPAAGLALAVAAPHSPPGRGVGGEAVKPLETVSLTPGPSPQGGEGRKKEGEPK